MWKSFLLLLGFLPQNIWAAGLVPCGGAGEPLCQTCHAAKLISNVSEWIVTMMGFVAVIMIVYSGLRMVISVGNVSAKQYAKKNISKVLIGYALVLAGWVLIDTVMKLVLKDQTYGVWNEVTCVNQPSSVKN